MPVISVIMPVYNPGSRLQAAIDSIRGQTFRGWELLLIDDGSTDGSAAVCDAAAAQDRRIRAVHQPNAGICAARNCGLAQAAGQYLAFCDDDDRYESDFLANAWALAERYTADAVRLEYRLTRELPDGGARELPHAVSALTLLQRKDGGMAYDAYLRAAGPLFVWNTLYRRARVGTLCFDEQCRYGLEDFVFNAAFHQAARVLVYSPTVGYRHREHGASTSVQRNTAVLAGRFAALAPWMEQEYRAALAWCAPGELPAVWQERKANAVTFLMHQLRDAQADPQTEKKAWKELRRVLETGRNSKTFDFLRLAGQNRKQMAALALYQLHLQSLYRWIRNKEGSI